MSLPLSSPRPLCPPSLGAAEASHGILTLQLFDGFRASIPTEQDSSPRKAGWEHHSISWELLDGSPIGMALVDTDGRLLQANRALGLLLQFDEGELAGAHLCELVFPGEALADPVYLQELVTRDPFSTQIECRLCRKDGTAAVTRVSFSPGFHPWHGGHLLAVFEDLSVREELERQLYQSQKTEALGRLAGGITHDFSNMLAVIVGYTQMLLEGSSLDEQQRQRLEIVHSAGKRAEGLTRQLLDFSRRRGTAPRLVDLNELLDHMLPWLRSLVGEDVAISLTLQPGLGAVRTDPVQIEQVLLNLVVNAREALPRGGEVRIETRWMESEPTPSEAGEPDGGR